MMVILIMYKVLNLEKEKFAELAELDILMFIHCQVAGKSFH